VGQGQGQGFGFFILSPIWLECHNFYVKASRMGPATSAPPSFIRLSCPLFGPRKSAKERRDFLGGGERPWVKVSGGLRALKGSGRPRLLFMTMFVCYFASFFCPFRAQSIFIAQLAYATAVGG